MFDNSSRSLTNLLSRNLEQDGSGVQPKVVGGWRGVHEFSVPYLSDLHNELKRVQNPTYACCNICVARLDRSASQSPRQIRAYHAIVKLHLVSTMCNDDWIGFGRGCVNQ